MDLVERFPHRDYLACASWDGVRQSFCSATGEAHWCIGSDFVVVTQFDDSPDWWITLTALGSFKPMYGPFGSKAAAFVALSLMRAP